MEIIWATLILNTIEMIKRLITELMEEFREIVRKELKDQGHSDTGKLSKSMRIEVIEYTGGIKALLYLQDYYVFLEYPMRAGNVPYSRGSGARTSQLITQLIAWFRRKGAANPVAASFATVNVWLKEGRPTDRSYAFSRNNRRTGFMKQSVKTWSKGLAEKIEGAYIESTNDHYRAVFKSLDNIKLRA